MKRFHFISAVLFFVVASVHGSDKGFLGVRMGQKMIVIHGNSDKAKKDELNLHAPIVSDIVPGSPAEKAGLIAKDQIVKVNQDAVKTIEAFMEIMSNKKANENIEIEILRDGKPMKLEATLTERIHGKSKEGLHHQWVTMIDETTAWAGFEMSTLSDQLAKFFGVENGVLVSNVIASSPAEAAGMMAGDVVTRIGALEIRQPKDIKAAMRDKKPGDAIDFEVSRRNKTQIYSVVLAEKPEGSERRVFIMKDGESWESIGDGITCGLEGLDMDEIKTIIKKKTKQIEHKQR